MQREFTSRRPSMAMKKFVVQIGTWGALHEALRGDLTTFIWKADAQRVLRWRRRRKEALRVKQFGLLESKQSS